MRITLVISSLSAGGAERVMSSMANYWAGKRHEVSLITLAKKETDFYPLRQEVKRIDLDLESVSVNNFGAIRTNFYRIKALRHWIQSCRSEVIISFIDKMNCLTLVATLGLNLPVIVSERVDPRYHGIGRLWSSIRRVTYPTAAQVVVQTKAVADWASGFLNKKLVCTIPNPINIAQSKSVQRPGHLKHSIIAMGRLVPQKGFDLLLKAFAEVSKTHPEWSLSIVGHGPEFNGLQRLGKELGLKGNLFFLGAVADPFPFLRGADLFVLSSRFEGFPNVLLEAMACGIPVISTNCPSGPGDIIRPGIDGMLVPSEDIEELASAMDLLMSNETERQRLGARATEVTERFGLEKIMNMWEEVIKRVAGKDEFS